MNMSKIIVTTDKLQEQSLIITNKKSYFLKDKEALKNICVGDHVERIEVQIQIDRNNYQDVLQFIKNIEPCFK